MDRKEIALAALIIATVLLNLAFADDLGVSKLLTNTGAVLWAAIAVLTAFLNYRHGETSEKNTIWLLIAGGMALWLLGEATWLIYETGLGIETPYPSIADLFWLAGYIPLTTAFVLMVKTFSRLTMKRAAAYTLLGLALGCLVWLTTGEAMLGAESTAELVTNLAYPLADTFLLSIGVSILAMFAYAPLVSAWRWIAGGLLLMGISDVAFTWVVAHGLYYTAAGTLLTGLGVDMVYQMAYFLLAIGFLKNKSVGF